MSTELQMLTYAVILGIIQLFIQAQVSTAQRGLKWNLSCRDEGKPALTGVAGRLDRAFKNFMETFPFFAVAVLMVTQLKANTSLSALGAEVYFFGRVVHLFLYGAGIPVLRTLTWLTTMVGIALVLSALF